MNNDLLNLWRDNQIQAGEGHGTVSHFMLKSVVLIDEFELRVDVNLSIGGIPKTMRGLGELGKCFDDLCTRDANDWDLAAKYCHELWKLSHPYILRWNE